MHRSQASSALFLKHALEMVGFRQRLKRAREAESAGAGSATGATLPSNLASALLTRWPSGQCSARDVQAIAHAALRDGLQHDEVAKLASLGDWGRFVRGDMATK